MSRANLNDSGPLELFPEWQEPITSRRLFRAGLGSLLVHVAVLALFLTLPETSTRFTGPPVTADFRKAAVPLFAPKIFEVTQKDENKGKVTHQLDIRSSLREAPPKARTFVPPAPGGPVAPPAPLTPPPQIQAAVSAPPVSGVVPTLPQPADKPKIVLESVGAAAAPVTPPENPTIKLPNTALDEIAHASVQPGGAGSMVISPDGASEATALRQMQLLSDPLGVDFKPYLLQVLASVRRNWMAIVPDSARMGRRGLVLIQFSIDRRGGVPKLVIASTSGITAFDRAAVAGISASNPFPPLPAAYKGDQIRLQMAFSYNLPPAKP
ncbi:MAG: TonB family protein [Bryobacterales bacterium]|nr:TonB family protein [Bryobacterales bacterium]